VSWVVGMAALLFFRGGGLIWFRVVRAGAYSGFSGCLRSDGGWE